MQRGVSGLYEWRDPGSVPFDRQELRLDVDGSQSLSAASGVGFLRSADRVYWLASRLREAADASVKTFLGRIDHRWGEKELFPYDEVRIEVGHETIQVILTSPHAPPQSRRYRFVSEYFREVAFEFDVEQGLQKQLDFDTRAHPSHPSSIAREILSVDEVFRRAGFQVHHTGGNSEVPSPAAQRGWTDSELFDAMREHFQGHDGSGGLPMARRPALWTFFATSYRSGNDIDHRIGGKMFDHAERRGAAVFLNSSMYDPVDQRDQESWVRRMIVWATIHEMGHGFNLNHSFERPGDYPLPFLPQLPAEIPSFMGYPREFPRRPGSSAKAHRYFEQFPFQFTPDELLFVRHAPAHKVLMGGPALFHNGNLDLMSPARGAAFELIVRTNRQEDEKNEYEFLEPLTLELKLKNVSSDPRLVPDDILENFDELTIVVSRRQGEAKRYHPMSHCLRNARQVVLMPGESLFSSCFLSAGGDGWLVDSPGYYEIRAGLQIDFEDIVSSPLNIRVTPPRSWDEEYLAQDFFDEEVGHVLTLDGSRQLRHANDVLREVVARLPDRRVALHSQVALAIPSLQPYKMLQRAADGHVIQLKDPDLDRAMDLAKALMGTRERAVVAAETMGHIDFSDYVKQLVKSLRDTGEAEKAEVIGRRLLKTLRSRGVPKKVRKEISKQLSPSSDEGNRN